MALRLSTALRNEVLDNGLNATFNGHRLDIYSGSQPTTADTAPTGTLLCTITLPADVFSAASGGTISKSGVWSGTASATGTAGYARLRRTTDAGTTNTTDIRIDGTLGTTGTDFIIDNASIQSGATITVSSFSFTLPAQ
jgi:hypothetical protein